MARERNKILSLYVDGFLGFFLIPCIMFARLYEQLKPQPDRLDLLYTTVAIGTFLATAYASSSLYLQTFTRNRSQMTVLMALLMTTMCIVGITFFNGLRIAFEDTYILPETVRDISLTQRSTSLSKVFRYHFYSDMIPGLILFAGAQLCSLVRNELYINAKRTIVLSEATLVAQLTTAAFLTWALTLYSKLTGGSGPFQVSLTTDIVLNLGVTIFTLTFLPSYLLLKGRATLARYTTFGVGVLASYFVIQHLIASSSSLNPPTWLVDYIFSTHQRISLFSLWLSTLTACGSFSLSWTRMVGRTNSLVRKVFHLAVCVVFISGYNQDLNFTRFAAGGMVVVLFILEMIRAWQLRPMGDHLENICQALRGKWDNRYLTMSHIYLLVGTFLPLWLLPDDDMTSKLALSSGLISIGLGDTAAAIVGTFLGRTKLGQDKTVEGFLGNILAMFLFKLIWIGYTNVLSEFAYFMACFFTATIEVFTVTCDNLILPLVMILCLQIFQV